MTSRKTLSFVFLNLAVVVLVACGGHNKSGYTQELKNSSVINEISLSSDEYVFIEHHIHTEGEIIEGQYRGRMIDSPTYSFDEKTRTLRGIIDFEINDTLRGIYGTGSSLSGIAGGGKSTKLYGVYELPYEHAGFEISKIVDDGTVHLLYKGESITLKSGDEWAGVTSREDVTQSGSIRLIATDKITNHGILDKSKIEKW